jgi:hypothetical protein
MILLIASFLSGTVGPVTLYTVILGLLTTVVAVLVAVGWVIAKERIKRIRSRDWPIVPAVVDIVSVAHIEGSSLAFNASSYDPYYQATLTYTYHYPDEQMGDYSRSFGGNKENAESWANSYKGETIKVRVDPSDPTHSILLEEDL